MKVLLDTRTLIWWLIDESKLSARALAVMSNSSTTVLVSAASAWELAIKANLGKLDVLPLALDFAHQIAEEGFQELPISMDHAVRAGLLPLHHRDPFDRLLVAQSQSLNAPILSGDKVLDRYDVKRLW